jgi:hypothetical protein
LFFIGANRADPMPGKNERQGRSANIFFFHEGSLQGHQEAGFLAYFQVALERDCHAPVAIVISSLLMSPGHGLRR